MKTLIASILLSTVFMQSTAFSAETQMHGHMQEMETLMAAIKAEQDPEKLEALMQQHMELMRSGMEMMGKSEGSTTGMTMESRMQGMEQRMEMMQQMMGQMMNHTNEEVKRPVHQHKR